MGWFAYKVVSDDEFRDKVKEYVNQDWPRNCSLATFWTCYIKVWHVFFLYVNQMLKSSIHLVI
jgi:hypothetical protein